MKLKQLLQSFVIALACLLSSCANQATVGNNNSSSITIFGGGGGPRIASHPVGSRVDIMSRGCEDGGQQMGGGRIHMARCNHCGWSGRWEERHSHPCTRGGQQGPSGRVIVGSSGGFAFAGGDHPRITGSTSQNGQVLRSAYYGAPGTVINGDSRSTSGNSQVLRSSYYGPPGTIVYGNR